jgi:hypothetical protein
MEDDFQEKVKISGAVHCIAQLAGFGSKFVD